MQIGGENYKQQFIVCKQLAPGIILEQDFLSRNQLGIWKTFVRFAEVYEKMAESRRQTRSTQRRGQQTDAQFWSNQPDPVLIERGQADAIRLVRNTVNPMLGAATVNELTEMNTTGVSGVPALVFVDEEGLEEQFLTEDEDTQDILDTSANRVTTAVDTIPVNQGTQQV